MYSDALIDHFRNPRNVGELPPPAVTVQMTNPGCGDILLLSARFDRDIVAEVRFKTKGCTASIAAGSALTEWMMGKTREQLAGLTIKPIDQALGGLTPSTRHAAVLCIDAVQALLKAAL